MLSNRYSILILLGLLCLFSSCTQQAVYTYEDIVITRVEHSRYSIYTCNTSDDKKYIKISGSQNYYIAYICINKETKKVIIFRGDCLLQQPYVDIEHFQGDTCYGWEGNKPEDLKEAWFLLKNNHELLSKKYECYILCGVGKTYMTKVEPLWNQLQFPDTRIKATYKSSFELMKERVMRLFL